MKTHRREFIKKSALLTVAAAGVSSLGNSVFSEIIFTPPPIPFIVPPLPYDYAALEPHIDVATMQIHHDKHHAAYVANLNKAFADAKIENFNLEELFKNISTYPAVVRNNGGGHWNHSMFWQVMKPAAGGNPSGAIADAINSTFGTFDDFKKKFSDVAMSRFGSGWAWLVAQNGKLTVANTPNQDNPLMDVSDVNGTPLLCLDVWEHAYYLHYQNKRADYITAWWNVVNWKEVERRYNSAK